MEFETLSEKISEAARKAFLDLRSSHADEEFYAYALYTDSGVMTVLASANSVQSLEKITEEEEDRSPETLAYYKWATSEWAYEGWRSVEFKEISANLRNSPDRGPFDKFRKNVFQSMIKALKTLDEEGFFGTGAAREKLVLFVTVTDDNEAEAMENASAKILNSPSLYEKFSKRYDAAE